MTLQNALGDIALDASVQGVKTSTDAITTRLNSPLTVTGSVSTGLSQPLTDAQLRATAIPVSGTFWQATQPISGTITANAGSGTFAISAASLPLPTGAATQTTLAAIDTKLGSTLSVNVGLTDTQLRASPVAISGTVTANTGLAQPLTDTQLRASPLEIESVVLDEIRNLTDSINTLVQFLYANSPRIDALNRMTVNNSEVTQPVSGTVTATVASTTLTSGTLTNITQLSAQPVQYLGQDVPIHIYDNIKVT